MIFCKTYRYGRPICHIICYFQPSIGDEGAQEIFNEMHWKINQERNLDSETRFIVAGDFNKIGMKYANTLHRWGLLPVFTN